MRHLIIYSLITYHLIGFIYCIESEEVSRDSKAYKGAGMTLNHPDQNGYQAVVFGTEKHKYGYEIKHQGKHFHYTSTEKDGVRLGCYGHQVEGKQYLTQYVADIKGYRLVTNEDLITVYPKTGRIGKAIFEGDDKDTDDDDDAVRSSGVRYVFPKGCKGIDVQIDNSSRLRSIGTLRNMEIIPKLPVLFPNRSDDDKYSHYKPSNSYPGPSHIYIPPNMTSLLSSSSNVPSPAVRPPPPQRPSHNRPTQKPIQKPINTYVPPFPPSTYIPPIKSTTKRPSTPNNTYLPPNNNNPSKYTTTSRPTTTTASSQGNNLITGLVPPKGEKEEEDVVCQKQSECCDESSGGKLVIPIPLKNRNSNDCCVKTAKLIVPLTHFDKKAVEKLKEAFAKEEFDADNLIRNILENML